MHTGGISVQPGWSGSAPSCPHAVRGLDFMLSCSYRFRLWVMYETPYTGAVDVSEAESRPSLARSRTHPFIQPSTFPSCIIHFFKPIFLPTHRPIFHPSIHPLFHWCIFHPSIMHHPSTHSYFIHLSTHWCIFHPSTQLYCHLFILVSLRPFFHLAHKSSVHLSFMHPPSFIRLPIIYLSIHLNLSASIFYPSIQLLFHHSPIYSSGYLSIFSSMYPSSHSSI